MRTIIKTGVPILAALLAVFLAASCENLYEGSPAPDTSVIRGHYETGTNPADGTLSTVNVSGSALRIGTTATTTLSQLVLDFSGYSGTVDLSTLEDALVVSNLADPAATTIDTTNGLWQATPLVRTITIAGQKAYVDLQGFSPNTGAPSAASISEKIEVRLKADKLKDDKGSFILNKGGASAKWGEAEVDDLYLYPSVTDGKPLTRGYGRVNGNISLTPYISVSGATATVTVSYSVAAPTGSLPGDIDANISTTLDGLIKLEKYQGGNWIDVSKGSAVFTRLYSGSYGASYTLAVSGLAQNTNYRAVLTGVNDFTRKVFGIDRYTDQHYAGTPKLESDPDAAVNASTIIPNNIFSSITSAVNADDTVTITVDIPTAITLNHSTFTSDTVKIYSSDNTILKVETPIFVGTAGTSTYKMILKVADYEAYSKQTTKYLCIGADAKVNTGNGSTIANGAAFGHPTNNPTGLTELDGFERYKTFTYTPQAYLPVYNQYFTETGLLGNVGGIQNYIVNLAVWLYYNEYTSLSDAYPYPDNNIGDGYSSHRVYIEDSGSGYANIYVMRSNDGGSSWDWQGQYRVNGSDGSYTYAWYSDWGSLFSAGFPIF
ncbi:hypothetical protein FACS189483_01060 [Spirochaetia bacterium]|nr:hypothetical protein FACS189483_01060 [Spirochaetia bacterium]